VDINHGGAALLIGLLHRSSSPTRHACARTLVPCGPATR
jgi:hypothetical protein